MKSAVWGAPTAIVHGLGLKAGLVDAPTPAAFRRTKPCPRRSLLQLERRAEGRALCCVAFCGRGALDPLNCDRFQPWRRKASTILGLASNRSR